MTRNEPPVVNWDVHRKVGELIEQHRITTDFMSDAEKSDDFFYTNGRRAAYLRELGHISAQIKDLCPNIDLRRTMWSNTTWTEFTVHSGTRVDHLRRLEKVS